MNFNKTSYFIELPGDKKMIDNVAGNQDKFLQMLCDTFTGNFKRQKNKIEYHGNNYTAFNNAVKKIIDFQQDNTFVSEGDIKNIIKEVQEEAAKPTDSVPKAEYDILVYGPNSKVIRPKTEGHQQMVEAAMKNDVVFAIGPAGTGKTYNAVALAVKGLKDKQIKKIILTRPAVEAGENLGFLPGDLKDKIDPYLRPLYDALEDMIPQDKLKYYLENRIIEIAPLAYMRGRTLSDAYIILDEAQNTTDTQMKMFLTRIGPNSKAIITGDETQKDLPQKIESGLPRATRILGKVDGIEVVKLNGADIVRHKLVKSIVEAYDKDDAANSNQVAPSVAKPQLSN